MTSILYDTLKRFFDIIVSLVTLVALSPFLIIVAVMIKFDDGGPIFYKGVRAGRNDRSFEMLKFRTMVINADKIGGPSTSEDDNRITKIGKFLRRFKLDELPQFINVLKGEMSVVGPRPEVLSEVETYTEEERKILSVRPGITDWASLKYRNEGEILKGSVDPHEAYRRLIKPGKLELALKYVNERSFLVDMSIIFHTVRSVIFR